MRWWFVMFMPVFMYMSCCICVLMNFRVFGSKWIGLRLQKKKWASLVKCRVWRKGRERDINSSLNPCKSETQIKKFISFSTIFLFFKKTLLLRAWVLVFLVQKKAYFSSPCSSLGCSWCGKNLSSSSL